MTRITIKGYAIVSRDDFITDANGTMPPGLMNAADWSYFQGELDRAAISVLGRFGHEAHPNLKKRRRVIISSTSPGIERREDGWWWNPARAAWADVAPVVLPSGGVVAVPGGIGVFDLFLAVGFDSFHLSRAERFSLGNGRKPFSACSDTVCVADVLKAHGLQPGAPEMLDAAAGVTLTRWNRL